MIAAEIVEDLEAALAEFGGPCGKHGVAAFNKRGRPDVSQTLFKKIDYTLEGLLYGVESQARSACLTSSGRSYGRRLACADLFDSMFKGFPVGFLLFWRTTSSLGQSDWCRGEATGTTTTDRGWPAADDVAYAVLRGIPVMNADYREQRIHIAFRPRDGRFEVADAAIRKDPEFIPDLSELWSWSGSYGAIDDFLSKLGTSREISSDEKDAIAHSIDGVFDLKKYPFTALEIASSVDEEQVADIFVRINSEGVKLNQADFILDAAVGLLGWSCRPRAVLRASRVADASLTINYHLRPEPDQLLRTAVAVGFGRGRLKSVYQVLRGKHPETGLYSPDLRDAQFARLKEAQQWTLDLTTWHEYLKCLTAAGFRSNQMISSENAILYTYALFILGRKQFGLAPHRLRRLIARWFFMSTLTGRYTNSPETIMDQDLARLRDIEDADTFEKTLEQLIETSLTNRLLGDYAAGGSGHVLGPCAGSVCLLRGSQHPRRARALSRRFGLANFSIRQCAQLGLLWSAITSSRWDIFGR